MFYNLNWSDKNRFKIKVKDGKEQHFKMSIRSFDENIEIKSLFDGFEILTNMNQDDILSLTSVKTVERLE